MQKKQKEVETFIKGHILEDFFNILLFIKGKGFSSAGFFVYLFALLETVSFGDYILCILVFQHIETFFDISQIISGIFM